MSEILIDYTNTLAAAVGEAHGLREEELGEIAAKTPGLHEELEKRRAAGEMGFFDLPYQNITKLIRLADLFRQDCENVVVLGIGGSALGPRALAQALLPPYHGLIPLKNREHMPRLLVADNIDPDNFLGLLNVVALPRTRFVVVSKSGGTAETMSQFLIVRELLLRKLGEEGYRSRMVAVTDADKGYLRAIVDRDGLEWLPIPENVGGRFSVFTPVGLFPAALCGIDIISLLQGAGKMDRRTREPELFNNPAYLLAALAYLADTRRRKNILVAMPYSSALLDLAEWFQQLWAESLGKARHRDGSPAHVGSTPVRALGATDQHSQVQLYMEGPPDKLIMFLAVKEFERQAEIPPAFEDIEGVGYLGGHSLAELIHAEQTGTETALARAGRPSLRLELPALNSEVMGQLMYLFMVATVFAGALYDVNPLDQPGVELGKRYAFALMGRKGFEKEAEELRAWGKERKLRRLI